MNYAVITKAKAMYGKRLTDQDFSALCECRTVEECAAFLKSHPAYERTFEDTELRGIRLSRIEMLLKREHCLEFDRLIKGLSERDRQLAGMFIGTYELEFIMWALRNTRLSPLEKKPYAALYEPLIRKYSKADFDALMNSHSHTQVTNAIHGQYKSIIEKALSSDEDYDYLSVENELWKAYYFNLSEYIRKYYKKDDAAVLYGATVDFYNIMRVFRLREYFSFTPQEINPFIIRPLFRLTEDTVSKLCESKGMKEFSAVLAKTPYKRLAAAKTGEELEALSYGIMAEKAGKTLHFSKSAPAVVYSYMIYKSQEIDKIKTVIESVRYNLSKEMIENYVGTKAKAN